MTGTVQPIREIGRIARERGVPFVVDAAQSAGHVPIDVQADCIDLLAAPGTRRCSARSAPGSSTSGRAWRRRSARSARAARGRSASRRSSRSSCPTSIEPGSHNAIGIIGLSEGVQWVAEQTVEKLAAHDLDLMRTFLEGVSDIEGLTYYGPQGVRNRIGVFSVRVDGYEPHELSAILEATTAS